jgi:histidyl-tRNA synthetase
MPTEVFCEKAAAIGLAAPQLANYEQIVAAAQAIGHGGQKIPEIEGLPSGALGAFEELRDELAARDADAWCHFDLGIVRGLAYYTGLVFEIHETSGAERAVAGGGRYDKLVELFGGPSMPACGFGMGDVVLGLVLEDNGLIEPAKLKPRPDVFLISDGSEIAETTLVSLAAQLRRERLHVRHSYKATRNVGKLLGEAGKVGARKAVILGRELEHGHITVKDLDAGTQSEISLHDLASTL